ncbi:hypothetical protein L3X38_032868 [Prunus dulcis]|uniref:DUF1985 domain-containing protein n=1 Tax=Prunus dulcis TaxID=3755 RepID=A0AAD4YWA4_PRUDU|nr:hypothetical protein L3X38_032868 [Prunus dulcis]
MVSPIKLMIAKEEKFQGKTLYISHTKTAITKADPKTVSQVNRIKFIVGNKVIQFTAQQFCVVTGLRFGNLPFILIATNENCSLKRKYFCKDKIVNLLELEKAFVDCADEDDVFKLGLIWAYEVFPVLAELHLVVHEENAYIGGAILRVDVQLLRPIVIDKQQPYWTWGDSVEEIEEIVELFGDDAEGKTSTSAFVEKKDDDIDETATLSTFSKESAKNKKCVEYFGKTLASIEHYFKLEIEELKKRYGGLNEGGEGHEELGSPHMNEGGDNGMSLLHEYVSLPTESAAMEAKVPDDGVEPSATMVVQEAEMAASIPHIQVHESVE